jgi:hypothetical protein
MAKQVKNATSELPDLAVAVEHLTEEVRILRQSLDELRDDVVWAARQVLAAGESIAPGQLRRQYDPLAPDASTPDAIAAADIRPAEGSNAAEYCCDAPRLTWNGDPDYPGIACANCGYIVAEQGSVAMWPHEAAIVPVAQEKPAADRQEQGTLF